MQLTLRVDDLLYFDYEWIDWMTVNDRYFLYHPLLLVVYVLVIFRLFFVYVSKHAYTRTHSTELDSYHVHTWVTFPSQKEWTFVSFVVEQF